MRVSSLSDERIIGRVSRHFVPVWVSRDNYQLAAPPRAEQDLLNAIDADRAGAGAAKPARPATAGGQMFTVRTRFDDRGGNRGTSRDRIELTKKEWQALLPPEKAVRGDTWTVSRATAEKVLR